MSSPLTRTGSGKTSTAFFVGGADNKYTNQSIKLTLAGTMKDGSVANEDYLKDVVWTSSDPSIAIIKDGYVIPVSPGVVTITATLHGKTAKSIITIGLVTLARLIISPSDVVVKVGGVIVAGPEVNQIIISPTNARIDLGGIININT